MGVEDAEIVELVKQIEELEKQLYSHPLHKVCYVMFRGDLFKGSSQRCYLTMILR